MRNFAGRTEHFLTPDCRAIEAAIGYLSLGLPEEADEEIEKVSPAIYTSKTILSLRASIYCEANWWERLQKVAQVLVNKWPGDCDHWILLGCATRRCVSIDESNAVFSESLIFHDSEPLIHFHLACNAAHSGEKSIARDHLARALLLDPNIGMIALEDPDLAQLWLSMERQKLNATRLM
jgi:hypothetical protein